MKYLILLLYIGINVKFVSAQELINSDSLNGLLIRNFYLEYKVAEKRKILYLQNKSLFTKINPITYLSAGLLFFYQRILSEQIQANCVYYISCSNFTKFQIEINGFRGFLLGINQLNNCFHGVIYDYQLCEISTDSKIINSVEKLNP